MRREPLIIGGGPAGTAAAISLALAGHRPRLLERTVEPADKVCGDFLGADAIACLCDLGVDAASLGAAPIRRLRLMHRDRTTDVALPFAALGLSRRVLDAALQRRAAAVGAEVEQGETVRRIAPDGSGWAVYRAAGAPIAAASVFLATGKHDLRDLPRPGATAGSVGMKMYFRLSPAQAATLGATIALLLFDGGYAGLQPVQAGQAVLCVAIRRPRFQTIGGTWASLLDTITASSPPLSKLLADATPLLPRPLAVAGIPYGFLHRPPSSRQVVRPDAGLYRLGDQAAVIPSLTGDGIAIALRSGSLAAQVWQAGGPAAEFHRRFADELAGQMRLARLLHKAAMQAPLQAAAIRGATWFPGVLRRAAQATRLRHPGWTRWPEQSSGLHPA